jgi:hypothetical protein
MSKMQEGGGQFTKLIATFLLCASASLREIISNNLKGDPIE